MSTDEYGLFCLRNKSFYNGTLNSELMKIFNAAKKGQSWYFGSYDAEPT